MISLQNREILALPAAVPLPQTSPRPLPAGSKLRGPVHNGDQGISRAERPHAEKLIARFLATPGVDMIAFYDQENGTYELRSKSGFIRWQRWVTPTGELRYRIVARGGEDPVPSVDGTILSSLNEETAAAGKLGQPVPKDRNSYPDIFQRISQLFDHHRAPDFAYIPTPGGDPNHPGAGSHGVPDIVQSRSPLIVAGPGIAQGVISRELVRHEDIAPTVADLLGVAPVIGTNASGKLRAQLLRWQDGRSLLPSLQTARLGANRSMLLRGAAERAIIFAVDGLSQPALLDELAAGNLPNIARIMARGTTFANGSLAGYPTVTWANHNAIVTGAAPGHNGVINNSWFDRKTQREQLITDGGAKNSLRTGRLIDRSVETLYEAVRRTFPQAFTMAINQPSGRGAHVSVLDLVGIPQLLLNLPAIGVNFLRTWSGRNRAVDSVSSWKTTALQDAAASAIGTVFWGKKNPPKLGVFEFTQVDNRGHEEGPHSRNGRTALYEVDREIGAVLDTLEKRGISRSTAIVLTSDHGMEHQERDPTKLGQWEEMLKTAKLEDGISATDSTRLVYLHTMRWRLDAPAPRIGEAGLLKLSVVNDDVAESGQRPSIAQARVTITDATGKKWVAFTDEAGRISTPITPLKGPLRITIEHPDFSREQGTIPLDGTPHR